jgi:dienelactone hydrolase
MYIHKMRADYVLRPSGGMLWALIFIAFLGTAVTTGQEIPSTDQRRSNIHHLDFRYSFTPYQSKSEWINRAGQLRRQILVSAGLWPLEKRDPIRANIFGKIDRGAYTIEKVYFESLAGFYVTGNLYRPKNPQGKVPAILSPHGHWSYGRFENTPVASIPARAAGLARLGMVVFTYDMVGYGDSSRISHRFAEGHREGFDSNTLWSVNLLGLQLWNSIRSLDFLQSLPEVDVERIGCTGESGGGTQTFLLAAVDDRVKVAAPVNMISAHMQGGSLCENAPNLRIDTNNIELAALIAPRPLLMVSATGDWTANTLTVEYPAMKTIYRLFDAENHVHAVRMDAPHNYNKASREAVYGWFAHYFLGKRDTTPISEESFSVAPLSDLMVFYGKSRPEGEIDENTLAANLVAAAQRKPVAAFPHDKTSLETYQRDYGAAFRLSLLAEYPEPEKVVSRAAEGATNFSFPETAHESRLLSRSGAGDRVAISIWKPTAPRRISGVVLVAIPAQRSAGAGEYVSTLLGKLLRSNQAAALIECFDNFDKPTGATRFFTTYNRTATANRVQDILTSLSYLRGQFPDATIKVIGLEDAGLWVLLARGVAPRIERMAINANGFDNTSDAAYIERLAIPGIRRAGGLLTSIAIAPLAPIMIYNTGTNFRTNEMRAIYRDFGKAADFEVIEKPVSAEEVALWILRPSPGRE